MFERCLYFNTTVLARKLNERWQRAFAPFGLAPSHAYLVRVVLEQPGLSQQEIADEMRLEKSTITRFVTVLEKKKLVRRTESKTSLREKAIFPTKKAAGIHAALRQQGDDLYAEMKKAVGSENLKALVATLRQFATKIDH
jgi:DNA-binding MarR family transcriptional regulator